MFKAKESRLAYPTGAATWRYDRKTSLMAHPKCAARSIFFKETLWKQFFLKAVIWHYLNMNLYCQFGLQRKGLTQISANRAKMFSSRLELLTMVEMCLVSYLQTTKDDS